MNVKMKKGMELRSLGKMDISLLKDEFGEPYTDEVAITNERIEHIKSHHSEDFILFQQYGEDLIANPDMIIKDGKHRNTVFMVKRLVDTNLNIVVKIAVDTEHPDYKNSVITFYRLRNKNLKKLKDKPINKILYIRE